MACASENKKTPRRVSRASELCSLGWSLSLRGSSVAPKRKKSAVRKLLGHSHEVDAGSSAALTQGNPQRGTARCRQRSIRCRRRPRRSKTGERFRDHSTGLRSKVSKCFGSTRIREANHISEQTQCSCQSDLLPDRHAHEIPVANPQQVGRDATDSRPPNELRQEPALDDDF